MRAEIAGDMASSSSESDTSETEVDSSSKSESEEDLQEPKRKQSTRAAQKVFFTNDCLPSKIKSGERKQILEDSNSESESNDKMPEVNLGSENDPLFQGQIDQSSINKSADSMLGLLEKSANDPAQ
ncbi:hypothetical protein Ahy_A05g023986 isoform B [Arachis hypogaea]|uniref:Uncharacterized protein n=1 Tax=Arachis hypogaea TaxID=3818 RepID=A0A445D4Z5_ARAHY|nr:hypothetical protein Ahy_A05g023986 isoform B [Arachis hypogaea]